jgi:OmpA-OmpF porin, OOP family
MSIKNLTVATAIGIASLAAPQAMAQAMPDRGWYVGGSFGQTTADEWCTGAPGVTITSCEDTDTGWKLFGGYRINRNFAVEGSYIDFGTFTGTATVGGSSANVSADATAWGIAAVGIFPVGNQFELFGKLGFVRGESEARVTIGGTSVDLGDEGTELHYGIGAIYNLTRNFGIRAEWENVNDAELRLLSIGVQYKF